MSNIQLTIPINFISSNDLNEESVMMKSWLIIKEMKLPENFYLNIRFAWKHQ